MAFSNSMRQGVSETRDAIRYTVDSDSVSVSKAGEGAAVRSGLVPGAISPTDGGAAV